ncbi:MAG: toprim domain-containing protein [Spirosomataceae bacterium]
MNIDDTKAIPMTEILGRLDIHPKRLTNNKAWYLSPLRQEKTASFQVDVKTNLWYDFGEGIGGDLVHFVCAYLKSNRQDYTVSDALRWIKNMAGSSYEMAPIYVDETREHDTSLLLKTKKPIQHLGLVNYLKKRGIPLELAQRHLKELHVQNKNTQKSFFALGFENEDGGFELRNPFFKGCLRPKSITFIRGTTPKPNSIHLFEGFMDYLSAITQANGDGFKGDAIVLNSLSCLKQALPYLQNYGYRLAYSWMDNDAAGEKATATLSDFFKTQEGLTHQPMNKLYAPHKDVNAWHMHQRNLPL